MKLTRPEPPKIALTPRELAAILGVSEATLTRWRWKRVGPRYLKPFGARSPLYLKSDVARWLRAGARGSSLARTITDPLAGIIERSINLALEEPPQHDDQSRS